MITKGLDAGNGNDTDIDGTKGSFAPVILPLQPQEVGTVISPSYSVNSEAQRGPQGVNREPWALSPCPPPPHRWRAHTTIWGYSQEFAQGRDKVRHTFWKEYTCVWQVTP